MVKGTTKDGFKFSVDPDNVRDMRVVELAAKAQHDGLYVPELADRVLGHNQKEKLYDFLADSKGRVNPDKFGEALEEIMTAVNQNEETKNS